MQIMNLEHLIVQVQYIVSRLQEIEKLEKSRFKLTE